MYRGNIAQEYRGTPSREDVKSFLRAAIFFHQIASEEILVNDLIKEGRKCLGEGRYSDAIEILTEAHGFDKWKDLYGSTILSSLGIL
jgi:hypothetical protein